MNDRDRQLIENLREAQENDGGGECINHRGYGTYGEAADRLQVFTECLEEMANAGPQYPGYSFKEAAKRVLNGEFDKKTFDSSDPSGFGN